ncbi:vacuolar calcium ion transporter /H(+) exchanger [Dothidotthia symphoricarpi CBS 119687]|uniref:Vacuolar calcium ion transporter /H(+) exchanger n=1 Tax=Dothidotthia symphoricarpi CBS 119687 TaxID=1392245 RepID=A0A6A6A263_9PLEO|nr:vacuolar calcium ion transporter /H(+) exchanger [Dothidotthia symphoricarpi CBS 119687]KAF2125626.1 vacuolar calcium ion transporter /H(+) exchanger [Dothidotthia symphoricarpi CBS 119687]
MGEPDQPSKPRSVKSKAAAALGLTRKEHTQPILPISDPHTRPGQSGPDAQRGASDSSSLTEKPIIKHGSRNKRDNNAHNNNAAHNTSSSAPGVLNTTADGETASTVESAKLPLWSPTRFKNGSLRFLTHTKNALTWSWINVLLVFVPIGIVVKVIGLKAELIFSMNAIAIIPLAGLLAHATEVCATRVGDTWGALLNVSFGNAVELILFIILLQSNQLAVVQASLVGSILANLLLILGMAFLLGGLKYQEQVYNSYVTQMNGVMLALAVMSLVIPTAFHAAFQDYKIADHETLSVSRGTSIILLIIYGLYLLFQLKSHRHLYASTPQHIVDEESHPGVLADVFDSSSSSSSSSSSDDSDSSNSSQGTMRRKAKRMVNRLRRKSSASSRDLPSAHSITSSGSVENLGSHSATRNASVHDATAEGGHVSRQVALDAVMSGDEADDDQYAPVIRDFETASHTSLPHTKKEKRRHKSRKHHKRDLENLTDEKKMDEKHPEPTSTRPKVAFSEDIQNGEVTSSATRRPFRPALPSLLSNNVFVNPQGAVPAGQAPGSLRRSRSLPERINRENSQVGVANRTSMLPGVPAAVTVGDDEEHGPAMSMKAAIFMLLISTGLVAICADFMSDAIDPMVESSGISQAFIGLIVIPIVGNAAEHVTAVAMAMKNKMDLAIGIAVGSSIQIALFITPLVVILGWCMGKPMTLYFNIFETVCLFVAVLIVNFLILDGRSNYLEGSLLIGSYAIIALSSFFYPSGCAASAIGGNEGVC